MQPLRPLLRRGDEDGRAGASSSAASARMIGIVPRPAPRQRLLRQRRRHLPGRRAHAQGVPLQDARLVPEEHALDLRRLRARLQRRRRGRAAAGRMMTTRGQLDDRIKRIVPRDNEEVNGHWICDEGRLSYEREQGAARSWRAAGRRRGRASSGTTPRSRPRPRSWRAAAEAARAAAIALAPARSARTSSPGASCSRRSAARASACGALVRGEDDALLLRADKGANAHGRRAGSSGRPRRGARARRRRPRRGRRRCSSSATRSIPTDTRGAPPSARAGCERRLRRPVRVGARREARPSRFPAASWSEEDGTFVNFEGRVQRVRRCHLPRGRGPARAGGSPLDVAAAAGAARFPPWTVGGRRARARWRRRCPSSPGSTPTATRAPGRARRPRSAGA